MKKLLIVGLFLILNMSIFVSAEEVQLCQAIHSDGSAQLSGLYGVDEETRGAIVVGIYTGEISKENCEKLYIDNNAKLDVQICEYS